jgi:glutathionylspermidine synthase
MKKLNEKYAEIIRARFEENVISGNAAVKYMESSTAIYHGEPVVCLYMPKIFPREAYEFLQEAARQICVILNKVIARYLEDKSYRKLFPFTPELEELILCEAGYPCLLPIARLDIFFNEEDFSFKFCEFNADGASAMNENREITIAASRSDAFIEMNKLCKLQGFELFDSWVREFAEIYSKYGKKTENPRIAIVDFMENATLNEFEEFRKAFQKAGYATEIAEIRSLKYVNGNLQTPDGKKIDAIYRRAVTCDIMHHKDEIQPFLQAVRDNAVCLIGHFRTQIIHNKSVFKILRMPETFEFLTQTEREYVLRHIPETFSLTKELIAKIDILQNKNKWLIKPEDLYGSRGVYAGADTDIAAWKNTVNELADTGYLLQEFCPPYKSENLDFNETQRPGFKMYNNITGMFVYNGKLQGLYSRAGLTGIISSGTRGLTLASFTADFTFPQQHVTM